MQLSYISQNTHAAKELLDDKSQLPGIHHGYYSGGRQGKCPSSLAVTGLGAPLSSSLLKRRYISLQNE